MNLLTTHHWYAESFKRSDEVVLSLRSLSVAPDFHAANHPDESQLETELMQSSPALSEHEQSSSVHETSVDGSLEGICDDERKTHTDVWVVCATQSPTDFNPEEEEEGPQSSSRNR